MGGCTTGTSSWSPRIAIKCALTLRSSGPARKATQATQLRVNATGLRTASWRCDLGVELPLVADGSPRPKAEVHDRLLSVGGRGTHVSYGRFAWPHWRLIPTTPRPNPHVPLGLVSRGGSLEVLHDFIMGLSCRGSTLVTGKLSGAPFVDGMSNRRPHCRVQYDAFA